ncbi:hypothetical protein BV25DRAFT_1896657 [Artomyces pyxidatus]|uniref:Uncharacterized protein n=1 Tax=Artomyces pyxidatus TaxID=48021 RepID=A0ACB8TGN4_9AGAM|nr:hypothetical protein BV25DRAFT_1896657 [Artomyces pyxidatus]
MRGSPASGRLCSRGPVVAPGALMQSHRYALQYNITGPNLSRGIGGSGMLDRELRRALGNVGVPALRCAGCRAPAASRVRGVHMPVERYGMPGRAAAPVRRSADAGLEAALGQGGGGNALCTYGCGVRGEEHMRSRDDLHGDGKRDSGCGAPLLASPASGSKFAGASLGEDATGDWRTLGGVQYVAIAAWHLLRSLDRFERERLLGRLRTARVEVGIFVTDESKAAPPKNSLLPGDPLQNIAIATVTVGPGSEIRRHMRRLRGRMRDIRVHGKRPEFATFLEVETIYPPSNRVSLEGRITSKIADHTGKYEIGYCHQNKSRRGVSTVGPVAAQLDIEKSRLIGLPRNYGGVFVGSAVDCIGRLETVSGNRIYKRDATTPSSIVGGRYHPGPFIMFLRPIIEAACHAWEVEEACDGAVSIRKERMDISCIVAHVDGSVRADAYAIWADATGYSRTVREKQADMYGGLCWAWYRLRNMVRRLVLVHELRLSGAEGLRPEKGIAKRVSSVNHNDSVSGWERVIDGREGRKSNLQLQREVLKGIYGGTNPLAVWGFTGLVVV